MKIGSLVVSAIMIISLSLNMNVFTAKEKSSSEIFIEYDCITGEHKEFTLNNIYTTQTYSSTIQEKISLPYNIGKTEESEQSDNSKSILPNETLTQVDADDEPYCRVTYLRLGRDTDDDGEIDSWAGGTGFMVYSNIMLTAAHCVYSLNQGTIEELRIYVKQNGDDINETYYSPQSWLMSSNYEDSENSSFDWCIVKLQQDMGYSLGWFGYGVATSSKSITVSGYPDYEEYYHYQYSDTGSTRIMNQYRFAHTCSTLGGQSGAPAYDSDGIVWGIHTSGGDFQNYGCLITSSMFDLIESYK